MIETATFANGCFWCTEAIFQRLKGVSKVTSGYSGAEGENPTYEEVSTGNTGFAEALQIEFDSAVISYEDLMDIFFKTHDPTTLNSQGNDVGTQYRSAIFYHNIEQKKIAEETKNKLESEKYFKDPIVTEVIEFTNFYPAEDYHQNFYNTHKTNGYCRVIIDPKVKKFLNQFKDKAT